MKAEELIAELQAHASDIAAAHAQRFFKTGKGQYGEGDVFIGVRVPDIRRVCRHYRSLRSDELKKLLSSPVHEHRLAATIVLSDQAKKAALPELHSLMELYLWGLDQGYINNWDIVDTSCEHIVGAYARQTEEKVLFDLARTNSLWHKRTAMVSCFAWLRRGELGPTIELAELLRAEQHDLLQKAVGWMLREAGNHVDEAILRDFLDRYAAELPRTMLRYAIEKLPEAKRQHYMRTKTIGR